MTTETWLCIDQGGQSTRAAVFGDDGELLTLGQAPLETRVYGSDRVEHDAQALFQSVAAALAAALDGHDATVGPIRGAALATQRSTLVCASRRTAEALSPVISWQDRRGADALDALASVKADRIRELTGLRVSPHYGAGKLRWCLDHLDAVASAQRRDDLVAAPLASFLLRRLGVGSGWQVDPANGSRMLLMDVVRLDWSAELLGLFGLQKVSLPQIHPSRHDYGTLAVAGRQIPLQVCTGDQSAALFCAGIPGAGTVFINIGTGAFIQCSTGAEPIFDSSLLTSVVWQDESSQSYVLEGTVNGAASAVEAALAELGIPRPAPHDIEAALTAIALAPLYLNGTSGLGSPDWVPDFESRYVAYRDDYVAYRDDYADTAYRDDHADTAYHDDGAASYGPHGADAAGGAAHAGHPRTGALPRVAAVYESIVFLIMRNLDRMRRLVPLERIVITGGLARLDWIGQQLASLSGLPVERPADPEATLRGLFFLLRRANGEDLPTRTVATRFTPRNADLCARRYRAWTRALEHALERERGARAAAGPSER